jgi:hypothetical protein
MRRINHFVKRIPIKLLFVLPVVLYLAVALLWQSRSLYPMNGDEPHYLLITDSLVRDRDVLVENNYLIDTPVQQVTPVRLSDPVHFKKHVYNQFSVHNLGLPFILALPYAIAGAIGAKIFMVLLAGFWPLLLYRALFQITESQGWSALIAFTLALGLPFAAASNQIYPDLIGGLIVLYVTEKIFGILQGKYEPSFSLRSKIWIGALIAFLPWLHIRLIAPAIILVLGYTYAQSRRPESRPIRRQSLVLIAIVAGSIILLAAYNRVAFGNLFGPYEKDSLSFDVGKTGMIFLGLHWDQSQGMFMQQPLLLMGLIGIVPLVKGNQRGAALLAILYLTILLPNAMHTNWYGGFSFVGRFWWTAVALWIFPLAYTVRFILKRSELSILLLCLAGIVLQGWLAARWLFQDLFLLNQTLPLWAMRSFYDSTGLLLRLPTFKDFNLYLKHPSNYVFVLLGLLLIITGWLWQRGSLSLSGRIWTIALALGIAIVMIAPPAIGSLTLTASELNSQTGTLEKTGGVATGTEKEGADSFILSPDVMLLSGNYEVMLDYEYENRSGLSAAHYDIVYGPEQKLLAQAELPSSDTNNGVFKHRFTVRESQSLGPLFQFRVHYSGHEIIKVNRLTIGPGSPDQ